MKHFMLMLLGTGSAIVLSSCASRQSPPIAGTPVYFAAPNVQPAPPPAGESDSTAAWPRVLVSSTTTNWVFPPQVDSWDGQHLYGRCAVAAQPAGQSTPTYGVVNIEGTTLVDKTARSVAVEDLRVTGGSFPSAASHRDEYLSNLRQSFPKSFSGLPLNQLEAAYSVPPQKLEGPTQALNNHPPRIIFSTRPAVLVNVDGPPVYRPVPGTDLQRVINTSAVLFKTPDGVHYLHLLGGYLQAPAITGHWVVSGELPRGAAEVEKQAAAAAFAPQPAAELEQSATLTNAAPPVVYVTTKPAELIIFEGEPNFVPIEGTHLLYVSNTTGNVFKSVADQHDYVLLAGRWFSAPSLDGPWQYVPGHLLPSDFANIPDTSPKENVKASVPGTEQAAEALIANSIPQSTQVPLTEQMQDPRIDGPPQLRPIEGTSLKYIANSTTPIIEVGARSWYACQNGVWFASSSVNGPWAVATYVPEAIYRIPPSSPLHYLTYVKVYGTSPGMVDEGYTPGYLGTVVDPDGVVVYGTGYWYPPWIGDYWYAGPCTWGFGWGPCWTPWDDWCFDYGFGWGCGFGAFGWYRCHPERPWWGPYRYGRNWGGFAGERGIHPALAAGRLYGSRGSVGHMGSRQRAPSRAPLAFARSYNSRTGVASGGQRSGVQNVFSAAKLAEAGKIQGNWAGVSGAWRTAAPYSSRSGPATGAFSPRGFAGSAPYWSGSGVLSHGSFSHSGFSYGHGGVSHGSGGFSHGGGGGGGHGGGGGGGGHGGGGGFGGGGGHR